MPDGRVVGEISPESKVVYIRPDNDEAKAALESFFADKKDAWTEMYSASRVKVRVYRIEPTFGKENFDLLMNTAGARYSFFRRSSNHLQRVSPVSFRR